MRRAVAETASPSRSDTHTLSPDSLHYLAKSLLFAIPATLIGIQITFWILFVRYGFLARLDFGAFYRSGLLLRTAQIGNLYPINPPIFDFIHPAYEALLFVPLTYFSPGHGYIVWVAVNLVVLWLLLRIMHGQLCNLRTISPVLPIALTIAFFPVPYAIAQGQDSILLTLLVALASLKMQSAAEFSAGVLLGFGAFRFQFLVPIALLFLAWKMWKPIAGMISGALCALLASIAVTGISGQIQYAKMLRLLAQPASQHVRSMNNLRAVLFASGIESAIAVGIVSLSALALLAWLGRKLNPAHRLLFAAIASCLLSYHFFMHDMSVLVIPLLRLTDIAIADRDYLILGLMGAAILAPEVIILAGSANAMWACAAVPILFLLAMKISYPRFVTR